MEELLKRHKLGLENDMYQQVWNIGDAGSIRNLLLNLHRS